MKNIKRSFWTIILGVISSFIVIWMLNLPIKIWLKDTWIFIRLHLLNYTTGFFLLLFIIVVIVLLKVYQQDQMKKRPSLKRKVYRNWLWMWDYQYSKETKLYIPVNLTPYL